MASPEGGSYLERSRTSLGQVLDGTTMIVLELAFILLWAGIVMGAVWGKFAWGDYWAWDPKENWALVTWLAYIPDGRYVLLCPQVSTW